MFVRNPASLSRANGTQLVLDRLFNRLEVNEEEKGG